MLWLRNGFYKLKKYIIDNKIYCSSGNRYNCKCYILMEIWCLRMYLQLTLSYVIGNYITYLNVHMKRFLKHFSTCMVFHIYKGAGALWVWIVNSEEYEKKNENWFYSIEKVVRRIFHNENVKNILIFIFENSPHFSKKIIQKHSSTENLKKWCNECNEFCCLTKFKLNILMMAKKNKHQAYVWIYN